MTTEKDLDNWFTYHPATPEQLARYDQVNSMSKAFARLILKVTYPGADQTAALRALRRLRMDVNLAIACENNERTPTQTPVE